MAVHRNWRHFGVVVLVHLAAAACTETGTVVPAEVGAVVDGAAAGTEVGAEDAIETDSGVQLLDVAGNVAPDASTESSVPTCPGGTGCACKENQDCQSGFCIDDPAIVTSKVCAATCSASVSCLPAFICAAAPGSDVVYICVPKFAKLCDPCNRIADCASIGLKDPECIDYGAAGRFCGVLCSTSSECPSSDFECQPSATAGSASGAKHCVRKSGLCECSAAAKAKKLATACWLETKNAEGIVVGKCSGERKCDDNGLSACSAPDVQVETCNGLDDDCDGKTDETGACDDNESCTADSCDSANKACVHAPTPGNCDADSNKCTDGDACAKGKCAPGKDLDCDDKDDCTKDSCDAKVGCVHAPDAGKACNADDNPCTVNDACDKAGKCQAGPDKACTNSDQCLKGKCETNGEIPGACKYTFQATFPCNDGNMCTDDDKCDKSKNDCAGTVKVCDDQKPCTADTCDPLKGCQHDPTLTTPCNDDDACTTKDTCAKGVCVGTTLDPTKPKGVGGCNDDNPCTTDLCSPANGCQNKADNAEKCDDGNPCTQGDVCAIGTCKPGTNTCACAVDADCKSKEDGNLCNGTLFCDKSSAPYQCKVNPSTIVECSTANDGQCKATACDTASGKCVTTNKTNGQDCDADKSVCTEKDACADGKCVAGGAVACDDKNPCTTDACDAAKGCVYLPNSIGCDADGDACTVGDVCKVGTCTAGAKKVCVDGNTCTADACNAADGSCNFPPAAGSCDDGNACTVGDSCASGKCVPGPGPSCDDSNPCTKDSCDPIKGCANVPDDGQKVPCYSGAPGTKDVGACKGGSQACAAGKLDSVCKGEVVPAKTEACDGVDDTCNGTTDEGCKVTGIAVTFGAAHLGGASQSGGVAAFFGGSAVVGQAKDQLGKWWTDFGFGAAFAPWWAQK